MPHRRDRIDETERLRRSLVHLETAQRIGHMGSWSGELAYDYELYWSPALRAILGWGDDWPEPTLAQFLEMVHPDDRDRYVAMRDAALAGEGPYEIDCRFVTVTGQVRHAHVAAEIERDGSGRPIRLIGIAQDISASVRLFEQLLETEAARREVLHRLMQSADAERSRLAAGLHDGPIQDLTAVALRLEHALERGAVDETLCRANLAALQRVVGALRTTLSDLHPAVLGGRGLRASLQHLATTSLPDVDVSVAVALASEPDDACATTVVRIAQEALHNIRTHAGASRVEIGLRTVGDDLVLDVVDDGRGFDPGAPPPRGHLGLTAMRERAEAAGGELQVRSGPGGTSLSATIPCRR